MNNDGLIKEFKSAKEALEAGYKHTLTADQAERLSTMNTEDRLPELIFEEYRNSLNNKKFDTIEKIKIKNVIKFAVRYMSDVK